VAKMVNGTNMNENAEMMTEFTEFPRRRNTLESQGEKRVPIGRISGIVIFQRVPPKRTAEEFLNDYFSTGSTSKAQLPSTSKAQCRLSTKAQLSTSRTSRKRVALVTNV